MRRKSLVRRGDGCLVAGLAGTHAGEAARDFRISPSFGCAGAATSPDFRIGHGGEVASPHFRIGPCRTDDL